MNIMQKNEAPANQDWLSVLRRAGLRPTRQRLALCRLLFGKGHRHITAETLHLEIQEEGLSISLATVYNTLHQFTDANLLKQVVVDPTRTYFDTNLVDHHHFFYENEGILSDIPGGKIDMGPLPEAPEGQRIQSVDVIVRLGSLT